MKIETLAAPRVDTVQPLEDASASAHPSAPAPSSLFEPAIHQRPIDLNSGEAKNAASAALGLLKTHVPEGTELKLQSVETDDLGMTHVRFDRMHKGKPVDGERIAAHLDRSGNLVRVSGKLEPIKEPTKSAKPALSADDARALAEEMFEDPVHEPSPVREVVFKGSDGLYRTGYSIECANYWLADGPRAHTYLVDGSTGAVDRHWDSLDALTAPPSAEQPKEPAVITRTWSPGDAIKDRTGRTYMFTIDRPMLVGGLQVSVDIGHPRASEVYAQLIAPSGKSVFLAAGAGRFGERDLKGTFDVSTLFDREPAKGEWKLEVWDPLLGDEGRFNGWSLRMTEADARPVPQPRGPADDQTLYTGQVALTTTRLIDGSYELLDRSRGQGIETLNAATGPGGLLAKRVTDADDVWGSSSEDMQRKAAVDAHFGAATTYDYYLAVQGRDSIDGLGKKLLNQVNNGGAPNNAFWSPRSESMNYGVRTKTGRPMTALDIAGHEITHGMTNHTAELVYEKQSGGLNEAMSDIVGGIGADWYAIKMNPALEGKIDPYILGETLVAGTSDRPTRNFANPGVDGKSIDHFSMYTDAIDVHYTSGIANNAFYLLTHGGTNSTSQVTVSDPISIERGLKIFGRALQHYLLPNSTFADAREATIAAATDLYGATSTEVQKVKEAWSAVGVELP